VRAAPQGDTGEAAGADPGALAAQAHRGLGESRDRG